MKPFIVLGYVRIREDTVIESVLNFISYIAVNSATVPSGGGSPSQKSVSHLSTTNQLQGVNKNRKKKRKTQRAQEREAVMRMRKPM